MKAIKNNWPRAITALTLVLGVIFAVNALEKKTEVKPAQEPDPVTVYFKLKSNSSADLRMESNWNDSPVDICGSGIYLCEVTYDASRYSSLEDFLTENQTKQDIIDNSLAHSLKN